MKLVIGGAFQGKGKYAQEHFAGESIIPDFHLEILKLVEQDIDVLSYIRVHMPEYRDKVILCNDISCGVVPVDPLMRRWREAVGRSVVYLAGESDQVVRVFCGLGTRLV